MIHDLSLTKSTLDFTNSLGIKIFNGPPQGMKYKQVIIISVTKSETTNVI